MVFSVFFLYPLKFISLSSKLNSIKNLPNYCVMWKAGTIWNGHLCLKTLCVFFQGTIYWRSFSFSNIFDFNQNRKEHELNTCRKLDFHISISLQPDISNLGFILGPRHQVEIGIRILEFMAIVTLLFVCHKI